MSKTPANPSHTPLPWLVNFEGKIIDAQHLIIADCGWRHDGDENAKFIVTACNDHEMLKTLGANLAAALEQAIKVLNVPGGESDAFRIQTKEQVSVALNAWKGSTL